jgi:hypothetical protein
MNYLLIAEIILVLTGIISGFTISLRYLVQLQRKIDRLILLTNINSQRVEDLENFLKTSSNFQARGSLDESILPGATSDFM